MVINAYDEKTSKDPFFTSTMKYGSYTKILVARTSGRVIALESTVPFVASAFQISGDNNRNTSTQHMFYPQRIGGKFLLPRLARTKLWQL